MPFGLYHFLHLEDEQAKIKKEIGAFFTGAGDFLIHKFGHRAVHEAITIAVPVIKSLLSATISNQDKHATVVQAIKVGLGEVANGFSENDFADIISSGLSNVRREQEVLAQKH